MSKKKKTTQPVPPVHKAGPLKKAERRFFNVFNDKGNWRRLMLTSVMISVPASLITGDKDPSTIATPEGAEHVVQYQSEISRLARDSHTLRISSADTAAGAFDAKAFDATATMLAARLATDAQISEKDAQQLASMFLQDINDPVIGPELRRVIEGIADNGAFLEEARARAPSASTQQIVSSAATLNARDHLSRYMYNYFILLLFFETTLTGILRRASRRDDKLKQEKMIEDFSDRAAQVRAMLTPKGQAPRAPEPPITTPPQKKKRVEKGPTKKA